MELLINLYSWVVAHGDGLLSAVAHLVLFGSVVVKLTPTLKDDAYLKPLIKFVGKWIALDKYSPPVEESAAK